MVHDALRRMEEEGISSKGLLIEVLKEAAGSAFLGTLLMSRSRAEIPCSRTLSNWPAASDTVRGITSE